MYELLIKGGMVVDPAQGIHDQRDVGISQGKVVALASNILGEAKKVIDAEGMVVTPGLIDIHTHVADGLFRLAVAPDKVGVLSGVTTVCDAGSLGYFNYEGLKRFVIPQARTDVFSFLHISSTGQPIIPEIWSWQNIDVEETLKTVAANRETIKGIKLRAIAFADDKINEFTREMLPLLDKGDILVHVFTHRKGAVIKPNGSALPELREAIERGVVLDVAHGSVGFSFEIARRAMERGILPTTLSTDVVSTTVDGPVVYSLPVTMSKFMALGLSLDQVIEKTTINPAQVLGEVQRRGSLKVGMPADVSLLQLTEGDFLFFDGKAGNTLGGKFLLTPKITLKAGIEIIAQPRFRNYVPGESVVYAKGV